MEEVSQLSGMDSGNKLQMQKGGPWSLGGREARNAPGEGGRERHGPAPERAAPGPPLEVEDGSQWSIRQFSRCVLVMVSAD